MLLNATNVTKRFGETVALRDGSLQVAAGEIHGLLGSNGAGKSTLVKILAGVYQRDAGEIAIGGEALPLHVHPRDVRRLGVSFIHQDLGLIEEATVAENMAFGLGWPKRGVFVDRAAMRRQAQEHLHELGVDIDPERTVASLNGADQALVAIARAILDGARLMVLDEPTARLRGSEVDQLFHQLDALRKRSLGFIYVTHRLDEVFSLTDRVTVFRNGATITTRPTAELTENELISEIIGSAWTPAEPAQRAGAAATDETRALEVRDLVTDELEGLTLDLRPGEVLGLTGPAGTGSSLARVVAGVQTAVAGTVTVFGEPGPRSPREAIRRRIAYIPANRREEGLAVEATVGENLSCAAYAQSEPRGGRARRWLRGAAPRRENAEAARLIDAFAVRAEGPYTLVSKLSGGNQQKVLVAKWLQSEPRLLILDEPTQGVDVGTRREIYDLVLDLARRGVPLLVISADFQELAELCDRVIVVRARKAGTELAGDEVTQDRIAAESYRTAATVQVGGGTDEER
jgi:ribose transport system ATP-binding protein